MKLRYPEYIDNFLSKAVKRDKDNKVINKKANPNMPVIKLYLNSRIPYGKHKGKLVEEVMEFDSKYWEWFSIHHRGGICYWELL